MDQKLDVCTGNSLFLGSYPQGACGEVFPIEWKVLAVEDDRVLVISRYVLDMKPFHTENDTTRWEDCSLRIWLNGEFMSAAFDTEELNAICDPEPVEDPSGEFLWEAFGLETATSGIGDRVFLLSTDDISLYYHAADGLFCSGASAQGTEYVAVDREEKPCWWLRSSMSSYSMAHIISPADSIGVSLIDGGNENGVRPAMWLRRNACRTLLEPSVPAYKLFDGNPYEDMEDDYIRQEERDIRQKAGVPPRKLRPRKKTPEAPAQEAVAGEEKTEE